MSAFVDTSGLYALLVTSERAHPSVVDAFQELLVGGRLLWTTSYVVLETTAILQRRFGLAPVRDLVERIVPVLEVEWVGETLHRRALARLIREDRRELSLVDYVSFEFMRAEGLRDALALDADFAVAGYRLLPGVSD